MNIQRVIREHGLTQQEVADRLGVSKSYISQLAHNENAPVKALRRMADTIGCKVGDFFLDETSDFTAFIRSGGETYTVKSLVELECLLSGLRK